VGYSQYHTSDGSDVQSACGSASALSSGGQILSGMSRFNSVFTYERDTCLQPMGAMFVMGLNVEQVGTFSSSAVSFCLLLLPPFLRLYLFHLVSLTHPNQH
jgi:hypothetical protein